MLKLWASTSHSHNVIFILLFPCYITKLFLYQWTENLYGISCSFYNFIMIMWHEVLGISVKCPTWNTSRGKSYTGLPFTSLSEHKQFISRYHNTALSEVKQIKPPKRRKVKLFSYMYPLFFLQLPSCSNYHKREQ